MLDGMSEPPALFLQVLLAIVDLAPAFDALKARIQEDQYIGVGDTLPHMWHVGMLLKHLSSLITVLAQTIDKQ